LKPNPHCFLVSGFLTVTTVRVEAFLPNIMALFYREAENMLAIFGMNLKASSTPTVKTFKWSNIPF